MVSCIRIFSIFLSLTPFLYAHLNENFYPVRKRLRSRALYSKIARNPRSYPRTVAWLDRVWSEKQKWQIPEEHYRKSPWLFESALLHTFSHIGEKGSLICQEELPEFMVGRAIEGELYKLKLAIDYRTKESCYLVAYRKILEKHGLSLTESLKKTFELTLNCAVDLGEFYQNLAAQAYGAVYSKTKQRIDIEEAVQFVKNISEDPDVYEEQRKRACQYVEAQASRSALIGNNSYVQQCAQNFSVKELIKLAWRVRHHVEHFSQTEHEVFSKLIFLKRFETYYQAELDSISPKESKLPMLADFEMKILKKINKQANAIALWDSAFGFVVEKLQGFVLKPQGKRALKAQLNHYFRMLTRKQILEGSIPSINEWCKRLIFAMSTEVSFLTEFNLTREEVISVLPGELFKQKNCLKNFAKIKSQLIEDVKNSMIGEIALKSEKFSTNARVFLREQYKGFMVHHFARLEKSLAHEKPIPIAIPEMKTCR